MTLKKYQTKRDFKKTTEPKGRVSRRHKNLLYVIQEHHASHLHYDFRLELDGVLKSWAVPKGPSEDPNVKRLAVQVEDHPVEYGSFEGNIPKGQYGAGTVEIWDKGEWEPVEEAYAGLKKGHLKFIIHGDKLHGIWQLVRLKGQDKNWLLIKGKESKTKKDPVLVSMIKKKSMPKNISPQLATLTEKIPTGDQWLHEIKWDGYRLLSFIKFGKSKCMTRNQLDWSNKLPTIIKALNALKLKNCILDGELVAFDKNNISSMQLLQNSFSNKKIKVFYCVFDIIYYDGLDLTNTPLIERKKLLRSLIGNQDPSAIIRFSDDIKGHGKDILKECCKLGLEGVVSKKIDSVYSQCRNKNWIKTKCTKADDFVICGYTTPRNTRKYFGSLILGYYKKGKLLYCGHVGTGFNEKLLKELYQLMQKIKRQKPIFTDISKAILGDVHWVKPKIMAEVEYNSITKDHILRHPSFKGIRYDKNPEKN